MEKNNWFENVLEKQNENMNKMINFVWDSILEFIKKPASKPQTQKFLFERQIALKSVWIQDPNEIILKIIQIIKEKNLAEFSGFIDLFEYKVLKIFENEEGRKEYNVY